MVFIIGGISALLSATIDMLIGGWVLQGSGAAVCMTMGQVIAEFIGWRGNIGIMVMGVLLIEVSPFYLSTNRGVVSLCSFDRHH